MKIYNYDRETAEYTGESTAEKNQMGGGYLLPAFATFENPPAFGDLEKAFFENSTWIVKPYYKGKNQVDLKTKFVSQVDYYGDIKEGFQYITEETAQELVQVPDMYLTSNGVLEKLSECEYAKLIRQKAITKRKKQIENELKELDTKRVRAICEPEPKDAHSGETWLEYYNNQIFELRTEYTNLQNEV